MVDAPSRALSDRDCSLSDKVWARVQASLGPHTFDLMSLDSNCRRGRDGSLLPHYSLWPTPYSSGVNILAQPICFGFPLLSTGVSRLPSSCLSDVPGLSSRFILFSLEGKVIQLSCFSHPAPSRTLLPSLCHGICGRFRCICY